MPYDLSKGWQANFDALYSANDQRQSENAQTNSRLSSVVGYTDSASEQFRAALQKFLSTLSDAEIKEFEKVVPGWECDKVYKVNNRVTYGINGVNDPQIYRCIQEHVSQECFKPDVAPQLWVLVGTTPTGYPEWALPAGQHDAYNKNDIVSHNNCLWKSLIDGNLWEPTRSVPTLWEEYVEE